MAAEVVVGATAGPLSNNTRETEFERQLELLSKKEWFYRDLSVEQAGVILQQRQSSVYLVSNVNTTGHFIIVVNKRTSAEAPSTMEHFLRVTIACCETQGEDGEKTFSYSLPDEEVHFSDVVSAVEAYVALSECPLMGATQGSGSRMSLQLDNGSDDLPPEYSVADKYPGVTQVLPAVTNKVDTTKGEDADQVTPPTPHVVLDNLSFNDHVDWPRGSYTWRSHLHFYRELHCCHPKNVCHCCCHRGYYRYGGERSPVSIIGSGPLRAIGLLLMYCWCWPCLAVYCVLNYLSDRFDFDD